jgi:teichoic acid transport system permease protein
MRLGTKPPLRTYLRQLWKSRDFAVTVPMGDLRAANMNTLLGGLWHLLNPLLLAAVYFVVFGVIFNGRGDMDNFVAFLIIGLFTYYFSQKAVTAGSRTVIANMPLMQSITFPRAVLPLSAMIGESVAQVPAIAMMLVLVVATIVAYGGELPSLLWLLVVPAFLLQSVFNFGLACVTSRLTFHFRDMQQVLPYTLRLWLYLSGVFYTAERIPEGWPRTVFELNPLHQFIEINRDILLYGTTDLARWGQVALWSFGLAIAGFWFFRARESEYGRGY